MFVYTIQPAVKPVVNGLYNPVSQPVERTVAVRSTRLSNRLYNRFSNRLYNRFDNQLYRVNGVLIVSMFLEAVNVLDPYIT